MLKRGDAKPIGAVGRKSEVRTAKRLGARTRPASGAVRGYKGDMIRHQFLMEAKSTEHASVRLELDWLLKIQSEARMEAKVPALTLTFVTGDGHPRKSGKWVMVPEWWFQEAMDELHQKTQASG